MNGAVHGEPLHARNAINFNPQVHIEQRPKTDKQLVLVGEVLADRPLASVRRIRSWAVDPMSVFQAGVDVVARPISDL